MKQIPLTQGKFALVDDEDYQRVIDMGPWHISGGGYAEISLNKDCSGKRVSLKMHRFVIDAVKDSIIDHTNGDRLDNRRRNLRICTKAENARNRQKHKSNSTGYKGVFFHKKTKKFGAQICLNYKCIHLGLFDCPLAAARAYNAAAIELHGEFAKLNQIPE